MGGLKRGLCSFQFVFPTHLKLTNYDPLIKRIHYQIWFLLNLFLFTLDLPRLICYPASSILG
jgi:hypothetical protein